MKPNLFRFAAVIVFALVVAFLLPAPARADSADGAKVYQDLLRSTVWIYSSRGNGKAATGTGTLVDRKLRLVLTNYHVVGDNDKVVVMFPVFRDQKLIAEREYYLGRFKTEGIKGRVVARDKKADLAVVQLESVPETAKALPLAPDGAAPGQSVHSIGNPGGSGALWVYTPGRVRQVYRKKWKARLGDDTAIFEAQVVETDSATNPGDSGGPLVNDKGLMVGVTQGGAVNERLISTFIDVSEVRHFLTSREVRAVGVLDVPKRTTEVFTVKDGGKFFGEEAVKKANDEIRDLAKKYKRDLVIETYATVPDDQKGKVKAMSKDEKEAFFRKWARERVQAEQIDGVLVLICKDPSYLYVEVPARSRGILDEKGVQDLKDLLLKNFREKKYDEGLSAAVKFVSERMAKSKEK